ncbi:lipase [Allostella vacuolata]|nr:lipase [Stella vacuolata]
MFEPGTEAYLARIAEVCGPPKPPRSLEERRDAFDRRGHVWWRPAPDTLDVRNWQIGMGGHEIPVRLYRRKDAVRPPVILYFHGGGFVNGSIDSHDAVTWGLAEETGALVVSVQYRRPPESPYPAATDDCWSALQWVLRQGDWLDADTGRVAVAGDSAGGCLAAATAIQVRDRQAPPLRLQALFYPCIDTNTDRAIYEQSRDPFVSRAGMRFYWEQYLQGRLDTTDPVAAPHQARNLAGLAPAFVQTAEHDPLAEEGEEYAARLQAAGVAVTLDRVPGTIHGLMRARFASDACRAAFERAAAALSTALA